MNTQGYQQQQQQEKDCEMKYNSRYLVVCDFMGNLIKMIYAMLEDGGNYNTSCKNWIIVSSYKKRREKWEQLLKDKSVKIVTPQEFLQTIKVSMNKNFNDCGIIIDTVRLSKFYESTNLSKIYNLFQVCIIGTDGQVGAISSLKPLNMLELFPVALFDKIIIGTGYEFKKLEEWLKSLNPMFVDKLRTLNTNDVLQINISDNKSTYNIIYDFIKEPGFECDQIKTTNNNSKQNTIKFTTSEKESNQKPNLNFNFTVPGSQAGEVKKEEIKQKSAVNQFNNNNNDEIRPIEFSCKLIDKAHIDDIKEEMTIFFKNVIIKNMYEKVDFNLTTDNEIIGTLSLKSSVWLLFLQHLGFFLDHIKSKKLVEDKSCIIKF